jgi:ribonuclease T1
MNGAGAGRRWIAVVALALVCLAVIGTVASCSGAPPATPEARSVATPAAAVQPTVVTRTRPDRIDGLAVVFADELPREAQQTIALIRRGGPFPYRQDGSVFQNRERRLPIKPLGYYREYTVRTPGEDDRGARRIVTGEGGEIYYTADHYDSFVRVIEP